MLIRPCRLYFVYLFIGRLVLSYFTMIIFRTAGLRMSARIRLEYLKALFALPISVLDTLPSGQASNTITTTANVLQLGISEKLGTLIQFTSLGISAVVVAFKFSWSLTLVTCSVLLFVALVYGTVLPLMVKLNKEVEYADSKAASIAGEVLVAMRMIVANGAEARMEKKYAGWVEESRRRVGAPISYHVHLFFPYRI
jgi:ATP-binding cassette subfamily B (MDR/TAP) protein 1